MAEGENRGAVAAAVVTDPPSFGAVETVATSPLGPVPDVETPATLVRRVDEDRWLASRFAPKAMRERLEALYAFNYEIARTAEVVSDPTIGAIRLAWWRDGVLRPGDDAGGHPLVARMRGLIADHALDRDMVMQLIEARARDLDEAPFESWSDLEAYVDAVSGGLVRSAIALCLPAETAPKQTDEFARAVGRAWGYTGLLRALPVWNARRRIFFPRRLLEHVQLDVAELFNAVRSHPMNSAIHAVVERASNAYDVARDIARIMPTEAFPAFGYIALEPGYRAALLAAPHEQVTRGLLERQLRLLASSALGRV